MECGPCWQRTKKQPPQSCSDPIADQVSGLLPPETASLTGASGSQSDEAAFQTGPTCVSRRKLKAEGGDRSEQFCRPSTFQCSGNPGTVQPFPVGICMMRKGSVQCQSCIVCFQFKPYTVWALGLLLLLCVSPCSFHYHCSPAVGALAVKRYNKTLPQAGPSKWWCRHSGMSSTGALECSTCIPPKEPRTSSFALALGEG